MAIERTNTNLATFCVQVVGAPYWYGCFGQKGSSQLFSSKKKQYPDYYPPKSWTEDSFKKQYGQRVTDCAGLIKWFLWSNNMTDKSPTYKASEDYGSNGFWNKCKEKGKIATLPSDMVGILVFRGTDTSKNHVGVIVDNKGTVVEAKGHAYGTVTSKASSWGYWGKCHLIKYVSTANVPDAEKPAPAPVKPSEPSGTTYRVIAEHGLNVRKGAGLNFDKIPPALNYGAKVTVYETKDGWGRIGTGKWVCMDYLK